MQSCPKLNRSKRRPTQHSKHLKQHSTRSQPNWTTRCAACCLMTVRHKHSEQESKVKASLKDQKKQLLKQQKQVRTEMAAAKKLQLEATKSEKVLLSLPSFESSQSSVCCRRVAKKTQMLLPEHTNCSEMLGRRHDKL